jgi:signal transduction histidine kinase
MYGNATVDLACRLNDIRGRSSAYNTLGNIYSDEGNNAEALRCYQLSVKDKEDIKDEKGAATVYSNIAIIYRTLSDSFHALSFNRKALNKREQLHDRKGMGDSYNNMGNIYRDFGRYEDALTCYQNALKIRNELGDKRGVAFTLNNLATVYDDRSDFNLALNYNYKAAKLLEAISDNNSLAQVYNNIGVINKKLKNLDQGIKYSNMALVLAEKVGNKTYLRNAYGNLGDSYVDKKNFPAARANYEKGLALAVASDFKEMQAHFEIGLAICLENENRIQEAEAAFKNAIRIVTETKSERDLARYSNALAAFYCRQNKKEDVQYLLNRSIAIEKKKSYPDELKKSYRTYADYYQGPARDLEKSTSYYKLYCKLDDSLFAEDVAIRFAEQQIRYETEKKEKQILLLKQQEEIKSLQLSEQHLELEQKKFLLFGSALIILLLLVSGYFYFSIQKTRAQQRQQAAVLETEEKERTRIAKDIHDDLGSGLSKIKFLTEVVSRNVEPKSESQSAIRSISETAVSLVENMRDLIWALNPENTTLQNLVIRMREYSSDYLSDFPMELSLDIPDHIQDIRISTEAHRNLFLILKETLQNIVKHSAADKIHITVAVDPDLFSLAVSDNGKGLDPASPSNGNGLKNIRQRAEALGGTADMHSSPGKGLLMTLSVSLKNIRKA